MQKPAASALPLALPTPETARMIAYPGKPTFWFDEDDYQKIVEKGGFTFWGHDKYPSYKYNNYRVNYLTFLYKYKTDNVHYRFRNGSEYDLRRNNVIVLHHFNEEVIRRYPGQVVDYIPGHYPTEGTDAFVMKNPLWILKDKIVMYCETDTLCELDSIAYEKILAFEKEKNNGKKLTFFKLGNNYILCTNVSLYIHQIITGCFGNGKGTMKISVDHIDRNPHNNASTNLVLANREEHLKDGVKRSLNLNCVGKVETIQEKNKKEHLEGVKRNRKQTACSLPEGIEHQMMKKYVVYYNEWVYPAKVKKREYFKVENPKFDKQWIGSKSSLMTIQEKLNQANEMLAKEDAIMPTTCKIERRSAT